MRLQLVQLSKGTHQSTWPVILPGLPSSRLARPGDHLICQDFPCGLRAFADPRNPETAVEVPVGAKFTFVEGGIRRSGRVIRPGLLRLERCRKMFSYQCRLGSEIFVHLSMRASRPRRDRTH